MKSGSGLGGSVVSNNILQNIGKLKWCIKEHPVNKLDNGWRFLSEIDTDEYLSDASNMTVCDWETIMEIEPAVGIIFNMEIGTDITLCRENNERYFIYTESGERVVF